MLRICVFQELTREDLRRVLKSFLATGVEGYAALFSTRAPARSMPWFSRCLVSSQSAAEDA